MSFSGKGTKDLEEELRWVSLQNEDTAFQRKVESKGVMGVFVILGLVTTVGILSSGIYYMFKRESRKQQILMRYRVLAQGLTLGIATFGMLGLKPQ